MFHSLLIALIAVVLTSCGTQRANPSFQGVVSKVHDGDSIHLLPAGQQRVIVRLAGIDAPELRQPYGTASRNYLRSLVYNQTVDAYCHKTDRYQRELCVIFAAGTDVNLAMINNGFAWHYKKYQSEQTRTQRSRYSAAERSAKTARRGLWQSARPVAPWNYRS